MWAGSTMWTIVKVAGPLKVFRQKGDIPGRTWGLNFPHTA